jgi:hypothetical protein
MDDLGWGRRQRRPPGDRPGALSRSGDVSLMPQNRRRSSMAAESSPCSLKMARIAAAASSETTNMAGSMVTLAAAGKPIAG